MIAYRFIGLSIVLIVLCFSIANVSIEEFADGIQNMEIEYDGNAIMLARSLNKSNLCKNMGLKVKNITKNKIILKSN
ncbi:MAG: hypothetical protein KAT52_02850 [Desulfobacterales bacterium]|nr:hypothetical protein [Desulfobacterales bacterium]